MKFTIEVEAESFDDARAMILAQLGGDAPAAPKTTAPRTAPKTKEPEPEPEPEVEEEELDYETEVRPLVVRVSKEISRDAAVDICKKFKGADKKPCTKGQEVLPKDYAALVAACNEALENHV